MLIIKFNYDKETGDVTIDPASVEAMNSFYAEGPIGALDMLLDIHGQVAQEYNEALSGYFSAFENRDMAAS